MPFHLLVLATASAFMILAHRSPAVLWFDSAFLMSKIRSLSLQETIQFAAAYHTYLRPARALEWWLGARLVGEDPLAHHVLNGLAIGVAVWAVVWIATTMTGSRFRGLVAGGLMAVCYATVYPLLHFPYGVQMALAFGGFALLLGQASWRLPLAFASVLFASLAHEVFLVFALLPILYDWLVQPLRGAWLFLGSLPIFAAIQFLLRPGPRYWAWPTSDGWSEQWGRIGTAFLTAGLPVEFFRMFGLAEEFVRLRNSMTTPTSLVLFLSVALPMLLLLPFILWRGGNLPHIRFCALWLAAGTLPLLLPVGTPETYHLMSVYPAVFVLWVEGIALCRGFWRSALVVILLLWTGIHGAARMELFWRDLPTMARPIRQLDERFKGTTRPVVLLFPPLQVGAHYAYWPLVLLKNVCMVEPTWVWTVRRPPMLPPACQAGREAVVPITSELERQLEGARRMMGHGTLTGFQAPRFDGIVGICPLAGVTTEVSSRRYSVDVGSSDPIMVQFRPNPPGWLDVPSCRAK